MGATLSIECPAEDCDFKTTVRFDPGAEDEVPGMAVAELRAEHPDHTSKSWRFRNPAPPVT